MLESSNMTPDQLRQWLIASVTQRFRSNADLALSDYIFSNSLFHSIAAEQVKFLFSHRAELVTYLSSVAAVQELVEHCIDSTKRYTYKRNQFVNFTVEYDELLKAEYIDFIQKIRAVLQRSDTETMCVRRDNDCLCDRRY